ncbi:zinc finger, CCHC-type containing protein [Tanacetum coccineum]
MGIVLKAEKKLVYIEQLIPPIPTYVASVETVPANVLATHTRWVHAQQEIACLMFTCMTLELQKNLDDFNLNDTIKELKTLFLQQAEHEPLETVKALHACKQKEGYIGKIIVELHAMIKLHEKGLPKKAAAAPTVLAIRDSLSPKPKISHHQRRSTLKRTRSAIIVVKWVNGRGTVLPTYLIELMKKKNKTRGASSSAVEAIGSFDLILPNGLCIVLDNCHYASVITRGVISVSCLKDNGFIHCFTDYGILFTPPYTPQHNGVSERRNWTLLDMVRSMMNQTNLPISFWDYALESDARILNMVPTKKVEKTPYELWHGKVPNLSYLKVWGCEALVKCDTPRKLEPRSVKCIFVGYLKKTMGYYFYYPHEHKIIVARYSELFENSLISQEASGSHEDIEKILERFNMENSKRGRSIMYVNLGECHWTVVKNILKYLKNIEDMFLFYGGDFDEQLRVTCYTDAGYETHANDIKSQTGYVFVQTEASLTGRVLSKALLQCLLQKLNT